MRSSALSWILIASIAGAAHAGDRDQALRDRLVRRTRPAGEKLTMVYVKEGAHLTGAPGGATITGVAMHGLYGYYVADHDGGAVRVLAPDRDYVLALWVDPVDLQPVVVRETGLAPGATAPFPAPDGDGMFVLTGLVADGAPRGGRIHVVDAIRRIDGWIDARAVGTELDASAPSVVGDGWSGAPVGTKLTAGGRVLAEVGPDDAFLMRTLPSGRGELTNGSLRARGTLVLPPPPPPDSEVAGTGGVGGIGRGGVGTIGRGAGTINRPPPSPVEGACLYDDDGDLVGYLAKPSASTWAVPMFGGYAVSLSSYEAGSQRITLFARTVGTAVERCVPQGTP